MKRPDLERLLREYTKRIIGAGLCQDSMGGAYDAEDFEGIIEEVLDDLPGRSGAVTKVADAINAQIQVHQHGGPPKPGMGGMAMLVEGQRSRIAGW